MLEAVLYEDTLNLRTLLQFSLTHTAAQRLMSTHSSTEALSIQESQATAALTKGLRQRTQAAAISCLKVGRVHVLLHLRHAIGKPRGRLPWS